MANEEFNVLAQYILSELQKLIKEEDEKIFEKLPTICAQFLRFYQNYYENEKIDGKLMVHQMKLKDLIDPENEENSYGNNRMNESLFTTVTTFVNASRKLESILTGFKSIFLKTLNNQNFIQRLVVEDEKNNYRPILIQLEEFTGMEPFIKRSLDEFEGKLKSNNEMLKYLQSRNHDNKLYTTIAVKKPYVEIYQESRRRLNIFYDKVKKGNRHGEGFLLYKPEQHWIKFYVTTIGDVKEGYVGMVSKQPSLFSEIEKNIQIFAEDYIGRVDNTPGTLVQDIQEIRNQISVKSGSAQTGSHNRLIKLIKEIKDRKFDKIREVFIADAGGAERNRVLTTEESKEKIATMMEKSAKKEVQALVAAEVKSLQVAGNVLVQIEDEIMNGLK